MWRKILRHCLCRIKRGSCLSMRRAFFNTHLPHSSPAAAWDWDQMGDNSFRLLSQRCSLSAGGLHQPPTHTHAAVRARQQGCEAAEKAHTPPHTPSRSSEKLVEKCVRVMTELQQQELLEAEVTAAIKDKNSQHLLIRCAVASEMCLQ